MNGAARPLRDRIPNRTSALQFYDTLYSFLPRPMKVDPLVDIQIGALPPLLPAADWRVSGVGRSFCGLDHVVDSIRNIQSPAVALSEALVYLSGLLYSGLYSGGFQYGGCSNSQ